MIFVLLMLIIEGGTSFAIFIRWFADKKGIERELERKLYVEFLPQYILLVLLTAYSSAALEQLFFFHVVLIRKLPGSPGRFSSPRRRFSGSSTVFSSIIPSPQHKYRSSFDLKLTEFCPPKQASVSDLCCRFSNVEYKR
ncbi:hypothetical protein L6164_010365 [Bauhinia variegata]|uniref:Uncharacterized protein n=1 Tax=Bauhinia variegata TaxID=167791 RepID=A0ACB9PM32_BAUVA|nr:hypothetical protein L6164_010365 [Bauhinia variegata]